MDKCPFCNTQLIDLAGLCWEAPCPSEILQIMTSDVLWYNEYLKLKGIANIYCVKCRLGFNACNTCSFLCRYYGTDYPNDHNLKYPDHWDQPKYALQPPLLAIPSDSKYTEYPLYCVCLTCNKTFTV